MNNKGIFLLIAVFFPVIFFHSCLTTGDRVNMEEFKRQLEAGGQAMDVTQTAEVKAAMEAEGTEEVKPAVVIKEASKPAEAPTVKTVPVVQAPVEIIEKKPVNETKVEAPAKKPEPVKQTDAGNYKIMLAGVFAAAFAVFALIAFILSRRKKQEDEDEKAAPLTGFAAKPVIAPEKAVEEYREAAALKKQAQVVQKAQEVQGAQKAEPAVKEPYIPPVQVDEDGEAAKEGLSQPDTAVPVTQVPVPEKAQYGEGIAGISPTQFAAGSQGNAVHLLYKVGGDSPEFRTIKITVPQGWSKPGTVNTDEGYFTVVVNGGQLISTSAESMTMIIAVHGLPAVTGEVAVTYGERRGGSPGVKVQPQPGEGVFKIETEGRGTAELMEIQDSPVVDVN